MTQLNQDPKPGYIHTRDGDFHFLDWGGDGPQVHFLHANGFCAGTYAPLMEKLRDHLHIFASDIRGHGDTQALAELPIRHWRIFAEDLKEMIETVMDPPIIGLGHSLGAVSTYIAAALYPRLFSAIILMDPVIMPKRMLRALALLKLFGLAKLIPLARGARRRRRVFSGKKEALERFTSGRGIFKTWSPDFVEAYLDCGLLEKDPKTAILKCDPEVEAQIFEAVPVDVWSYAPKITCPVLVIRGEHSNAFYEQSARLFQKVIPESQIETIPQTGHFVPMEAPQTCARLILDFVKQHASQII